MFWVLGFRAEGHAPNLLSDTAHESVLWSIRARRVGERERERYIYIYIFQIREWYLKFFRIREHSESDAGTVDQEVQTS